MKTIGSRSSLGVGLPLTLFLLSAVCVGQNIFLFPNVGPPTTAARVAGSGFSPNVRIVISFDKTRSAVVNADAVGAFSHVSIQVPSSAAPGEHSFTAATAGGSHAVASFLVRTDWNQFQFTPDHSGVNPYENTLNTTNVANLALKWKYTAGDMIYLSSPTVANGLVYIPGEHGNLYALNASTGALIWTYVATGRGFESAPAVSNGVLYIGGGEYLYALNAADGSWLWRYELGGGVQMPPTVANS
jgi:glucose dehydrogenase